MCKQSDVNALAVELQTPVRAFLSEHLLNAPSGASDRRLELLRLHAGRQVTIARAWQESGMTFGVFSPLRSLTRGNFGAVETLTVNLKWIGEEERTKVLDQLRGAAKGDGVVPFRPVA